MLFVELCKKRTGTNEKRKRRDSTEFCLSMSQPRSTNTEKILSYKPGFSLLD